MDLVAPIVPDAQKNRAPDLLLEGLRGGMAAFAQFAQIRRQAESDVARLALQERLAQEQHSLESRKLDQAADLIPSQIEANEAHADLYAAQGEAAAKGTGTAAQIKAQTTRANEALLGEVAKDVTDWQLEDANFQTKSPVKFGLNAEAFAAKYRYSPVPAIRSAIKNYLTIADEQTVMMKHGAVDEDGNLAPSGQGVRVPLRKVALRATDPATSAQTLRDLEASGQQEVIGRIMEQFKDGGKSYLNNKAAATGGNAPVDYGTSEAEPASAQQYPIGTKGKRGGNWFVMTDQGWQPVP